MSKLASDSPSILNNLAYLHAERFNDLDKAQEAAKKARQLDPGNGAIADTLGWIHYRRGEYQAALQLLTEAAEKLRNDTTVNYAEVQFHVGMANYAMGKVEAAKAALKSAAENPADFPGKDKIAARLAFLDGSPEALTVPRLKERLAEEPRDVLALLRLAEAHEKAGEHAQAAEACVEALKVSPGLLNTQIKLAELNAGPLKNPKKALELARKARELAPSDPRVAGVLGGIEFDNGDPARAYTLLSESVDKLPDDPAVQSKLAWAAYSQAKFPKPARQWNGSSRLRRGPGTPPARRRSSP